MSGTLHSTPLPWLPVLSNIEPPAIRKKAVTDKLVEKTSYMTVGQSNLISLASPLLLRLTSRNPFFWTCNQSTSKVDGDWRHNWKSAQVVNSHLVCDPTIRQPGFDLSRQQWSLLNRFRTEQGHCGACRRKWWLMCSCGETQTMFHIVESCPLTKLNGSLSRLHSAEKSSWLMSEGNVLALEQGSARRRTASASSSCMEINCILFMTSFWL